MFKKILVGLAAVAIGCVLARSGYELGKHLARNDSAAQAGAADSGSGPG